MELFQACTRSLEKDRALLLFQACTRSLEKDHALELFQACTRSLEKDHAGLDIDRTVLPSDDLLYSYIIRGHVKAY